MSYDKDYIVILVCDNIPNQKFWNEKSQDWTSSLDEATVYLTYGDSGRAIWSLPDDKCTHRVTSSNKYLYNLMLTGKWDGYCDPPESNSESQLSECKGTENNE